MKKGIPKFAHICTRGSGTEGVQFSIKNIDFKHWKMMAYPHVTFKVPDLRSQR